MFFSVLLQVKGVFWRSARDVVVCQCGQPYSDDTILKAAEIIIEVLHTDIYLSCLLIKFSTIVQLEIYFKSTYYTGKLQKNWLLRQVRH
jgi:hypothetical protein